MSLPAATGSPDSEERQADVQELRLAFRRVFRCMNRLRGRDTHLGAGELSTAQVELLSELYERGELPAGALAAAARLTPGTVTQMLEHLAACGHVERDRSLLDRRVVVSRLTPQGRRKIQAKRRAWEASWEEALAEIDDADLRAAARVLERLGDMVEALAPPTCAKAPQSGPESAD
jgi:DNA-binding MarR family transcriptional regulator